MQPDGENDKRLFVITLLELLVESVWLNKGIVIFSRDPGRVRSIFVA